MKLASILLVRYPVFLYLSSRSVDSTVASLPKHPFEGGGTRVKLTAHWPAQSTSSELCSFFTFPSAQRPTKVLELKTEASPSVSTVPVAQENKRLSRVFPVTYSLAMEQSYCPFLEHCY